MRICIVGESPQSPTGFGTQTKYLGEAFEFYGNEVVYLSSTMDTLQNSYPPLDNEWRTDGILDPLILDHLLYRIHPDCILFFRDVPFLLKARECKGVYQNCPTLFWLAEEGDSHLSSYLNQFKIFPQGSLLPLTDATRQRLPNCGRVIPHGLPIDALEVSDPIADLFEKWRRRFGWPELYSTNNTYLINVDRNCVWKCWDVCFDILSRLPKSIKLIAHTSTKKDKFNYFDFDKLEELFGVGGRVLYTQGANLTHREVMELYKISDLSISTSAGEGFGLGYIEAGLSGTPQLANQCPAVEGILPAPYIVEHGARLFMGDRLWRAPDPLKFVKAILNVDSGFTDLYPVAEAFQQEVKKRYNIREVAADILEEFENQASLTRRRDYRWGLDFGTTQAEEVSLTLAAKSMGKSLFHLKCWKGGLVSRFYQTGAPAYGIEDEVGVFHKQIDDFILTGSLIKPWHKTDILVATDVFDHLYRSYSKEFWPLLSRFKDYNICFLRFGADYIYGKGLADREAIKVFLNSDGLVRRYDLEDVVKKNEKVGVFDHEIWARANA